MRESIGDRLNRVSKEKNESIPKIAAAIGVEKGTLYKWKDGTNEDVFEDYEKLQARLDELEGIITVRKRLVDYETEDKSIEGAPRLIGIPLNLNDPIAPYTEGEATVRDVAYVNKTLCLIALHADSSQYGKVDGLLRVNNHNLEPDIKKDSLITVRRVRFKDIEGYRAGHYYLIIDKLYNTYLGTITPAKDRHVMVSIDNTRRYNLDFKLSQDDILIAMKVEKCITVTDV